MRRQTTRHYSGYQLEAVRTDKDDLSIGGIMIHRARLGDATQLAICKLHDLEMEDDFLLVINK